MTIRVYMFLWLRVFLHRLDSPNLSYILMKLSKINKKVWRGLLKSSLPLHTSFMKMTIGMVLKYSPENNHSWETEAQRR